MRWFLFLILSLSAQGQITTIVMTNQVHYGGCTNENGTGCPRYWQNTNSITVSHDQIFHLLNVSRINGMSAEGDYMQVVKDGCAVTPLPWDIPGGYSQVYGGPITVNFYCGVFTYKIIPREEPIQPGTGVVIPTDASGPVQIVLESSADLVNWTSATPGTYGTNTTNRFFRVRAVRQ